MTQTFIETDCTIEHEGKKFTSGGAWICDCNDGYRRGVVYAKPDDRKGVPGITGQGISRASAGTVTDWHGNTIANATFGPVYQGAFSRMRAVTFVHEGVKFHGRYCPDWAEAVRVRSTKPVGAKQ